MDEGDQIIQGVVPGSVKLLLNCYLQCRRRQFHLRRHPASLVRYTNRPFVHQKGYTKRRTGVIVTETGVICLHGAPCADNSNYTELLIYANETFRIPPLMSNKKLSYRRVTARCVVSVESLPTATQQCRNYLYDKS